LYNIFILFVLSHARLVTCVPIGNNSYKTVSVQRVAISIVAEKPSSLRVCARVCTSFPQFPRACIMIYERHVWMNVHWIVNAWGVFSGIRFLCSLLHVFRVVFFLSRYAKSPRWRELFRHFCLHARAPNKRWQSKLSAVAVRWKQRGRLSFRTESPFCRHRSVSFSFSFLVFPLNDRIISDDDVSMERRYVSRKDRVVFASVVIIRSVRVADTCFLCIFRDKR